MTNCPNCGGEIQLNADKCAYCDTPYYDLACIPFYEPFILRLNVGTKENPDIRVRKVYLSEATISTQPLFSVARTSRGSLLFGELDRQEEYKLNFVTM